MSRLYFIGAVNTRTATTARVSDRSKRGVVWVWPQRKIYGDVVTKRCNCAQCRVGAAPAARSPPRPPRAAGAVGVAVRAARGGVTSRDVTSHHRLTSRSGGGCRRPGAGGAHTLFLLAPFPVRLWVMTPRIWSRPSVRPRLTLLSRWSKRDCDACELEYATRRVSGAAGENIQNNGF